MAVDLQQVPFKEALKFWFKLGFISFGGPAGQIAVMHREIVERKKWIGESRFLHALNYCMVLPGPEAQQLAIYIGWLLHKTWGGIIAGSLFVLPSLFILVGLSWVYAAHGDLAWVAGLFYGMKPAVTAIVFHAAYRIGKRTIRNWVLALVALLGLLEVAVFHLPFPLVILIAAILGWLGQRVFSPKTFAMPAHADAAEDDQDQEIPPHARFTWGRLVRVIASGLSLWTAPFVALGLWGGWQSQPVQMAWFFTKAALLTFGGAYAVLPYVSDLAANHYHWVTSAQMIDGLALGETTPGPLIMVVAFVGFMGGWQIPWFGPESAPLSAVLAASSVTYFTFLPSFVLIFAGAPIIETTHGNLRFTAPLTAITATVVGVIVNLAIFFSVHVFFPGGFGQGIDLLSLGIAALAALALFKFKAGVIPVLLGCGLAGLATKLLGL